MSGLAKWEASLRKLTEEGAETHKILHVVERLLALQPDHLGALRCKVVACLQTEKYALAEAALDHIARVDPRGAAASPWGAFHRAYSLYRRQRYAEAKEVLLGAPAGQTHTPSQHLLAQVYYHMEAYAEAAALYAALLEQGAYRDEAAKTELLTNYAAALSAVRPAQAPALLREAEERSADLWFNVAAAQIQMQDYAGALTSLLHAEEVCAGEHESSPLRSHTEALAAAPEVLARWLQDPRGAAPSPARDFFQEVAGIWAQIAFVWYATHAEDRARALLQCLLAHKPPSAVTAAVAAVNSVAMQRHTDFFDAYRKLRAAQQTQVAGRLTSAQRLRVRYNAALLLLQTRHLSGFEREVEHLTREYPESELTHSLQLVSTVREIRKRRRPDEKLLRAYLETYEQSMGDRAGGGGMVPLITAQLFVEQGDFAQAAAALHSPALSELARRPATHATLAVWKVQSGDVAGAVADLQAAVEAMPLASAQALLQWAVSYLAISRGLHREAVELLQAARRRVPALAEDVPTTARLAWCLSHTDVDAAWALLRTHDGAAAPPAHEALESLPPRGALEKLGYKRATAVEEETQRRGGRRARPMRRPPRSLEGKPDPERWIPMSVRSYIKDLPERRKRELKRLRAMEQEAKRRAAEKRRAEEIAA